MRLVDHISQSFFDCFLGFEMGKFPVDAKGLPNKRECRWCLNRCLSRLAEFQGIRAFVDGLALRGKRDRAEVFDASFEGRLIVFYHKKVFSFLFYLELLAHIFDIALAAEPL